MNISNAMIEITRKCNMVCDHCLRGKAQNMEISDEILDMFFSKVESIGELTITGGEPSLAPHKIEKIIELAKKHGVSIENFYIATNGKQVSPAFMAAVVKLYCYCSDNEMSVLHLSNDIYHDDVDHDNLKMLEVFKFFGRKFGDDGESGDYEPIYEGRAKDNSLGGRDVPISSGEYGSMDEFVNEYGTGMEAEIYLNCRGNVVYGCNWSYKSQNAKKQVICHVNDLSLEAVGKYFKKRFPKLAEAD